MSVDANRRTGRTTRMVEAAVSRFLDGNSVLILMPTLNSCHHTWTLVERALQVRGVQGVRLYRSPNSWCPFSVRHTPSTPMVWGGYALNIGVFGAVASVESHSSTRSNICGLEFNWGMLNGIVSREGDGRDSYRNIFMDHHILEVALGPLLQRLHAYDPQEGPHQGLLEHVTNSTVTPEEYARTLFPEERDDQLQQIRELMSTLPPVSESLQAVGQALLGSSGSLFPRADYRSTFPLGAPQSDGSEIVLGRGRHAGVGFSPEERLPEGLGRQPQEEPSIWEPLERSPLHRAEAQRRKISQEKEVPLIGGPGERALSMASLCDGQYKE